MLLHGFALDPFGGVVVLEGERVPGIRALVLDLFYVRKKFSHENIMGSPAHWRQAVS
jgi:hypothetical protein